MPNIDLKSSRPTAWSGYFSYSISQNISENYSKITIKVFAKKEDGASSGGNKSWNASVEVAGVQKNLSSNPGFVLRPTGAYIGSDSGEDSVSFKVYHDSDGSASPYVSISVTPPSDLSWASARLTYGDYLTIDSIPRDSGISAADDVYFGENCQITWKPASKDFSYYLDFYMSDDSGLSPGVGDWYDEVGPIYPGTDDYYTYSGYQIPIEIIDRIPNSDEGIIYVGLRTYDGDEQVGSTTSSYFSATVPDTIVPSIESCLISISNNMNDTVQGWGVALAGYSGAKITATASGVNGSTIKTYNISGAYRATVSADSDNPSEFEYVGDALRTSGNYKFIITCTDSRGRISNSFTSDEFIVLPYSPPDVKKLTVTKNEHGTDDIQDDRMVVLAEWVVDPVNGYNSTRSAKIYYKRTNEDTWWLYPTELANGVSLELSGLELDEEASYNFKVVVDDLVGKSAERTAFTSTTQVLLDFRAGGRGLGIGGICTSDGMEVLMNATFYNELYLMRDANMYDIGTYITNLAVDVLNEHKAALLDSVYPVGSIYVSITEKNPGTLFGVGTWERIKDRFLFAAIDEEDLLDTSDPDDPNRKYLPGSMDGEKEHTLTIQEMPKHDHWGVYRPSWYLHGETGQASGVSDGASNNQLFTDKNGGDAPHNNMPPYLAVYMWKRVA